MAPTLFNLILLAALSAVLGCAAGWEFLRKLRRPALACVVLAVAGAIMLALMPEPTDNLYLADIDQRVSFLIMQMLAWLGWMFGVVVAVVGASDWHTDANDAAHRLTRQTTAQHH